MLDSRFTGFLVSVRGSRCLPHFITFGTTVGFGIDGQILNITEVTTVEVQVHGVGVATVGTLYELSRDGGRVVIFVM
jgi:glutamate dehydrogenase/leucine dehydrogenase